MASSDVFINVKANVKDALKGIDDFARSANDSILGLVKGYGAVTAAAAAVGVALVKAFDVAESIANLADETNKINQQFDALATNAGASAADLRLAFSETNQGINDLEDVLKTASVAIANLNLPAQDIAKNFEAARRVSIGFGVDANEAFDKINTAIASGNTRVLRQIGIFIDSKQAVDEYARSIGTATKYLTDAQKESALFNAIQNKISTTFKNVDINTKTTSEAFLTFKTAAGDVTEAVAIGLNKMFGPAIQTLLGKFSGVLANIANTILKNVGSESEKAAAKQELLKDEIESTRESLQKTESLLSSARKSGTVYAQVAINQYTAERDEIKKKLIVLENEKKLQLELAAEQSRRLESAANNTQKIKEKSAEQIKVEEALAKDRAEFANKAIAAQSALTDSTLKSSTDRVKISEAETAKELEIRAQGRQKQIEIDRAAEGLGVVARQQASDAKVAIEAATLAQIEQLRLEADQRQLEAEVTNQTLRGDISVEGGLKRSLVEKQVVDAQLAEARRGSEEEKKLKLKSLQLENDIAKQKVAAATTALGNLSSLMQTNSKELFAIGKAAAIADATIRGFQAYNLALATIPPPFGAIVGATSLIAAGVQVAKISSTNLATGITEVPGGFPNDSFRANLTSGERVLSVDQNKDLTTFLEKSQSGSLNGDGVISILDRIADRLSNLENTIVVNIGNKEIVREVRDGLRAGRTLAV